MRTFFKLMRWVAGQAAAAADRQECILKTSVTNTTCYPKVIVIPLTEIETIQGGESTMGQGGDAEVCVTFT